jgi:hypothetical protein
MSVRGPQGQNPRTTCGPRTTVWKTLLYMIHNACINRIYKINVTCGQVQGISSSSWSHGWPKNVRRQCVQKLISVQQWALLLYTCFAPHICTSLWIIQRSVKHWRSNQCVTGTHNTNLANTKPRSWDCSVPLLITTFLNVNLWAVLPAMLGVRSVRFWIEFPTKFSVHSSPSQFATHACLPSNIHQIYSCFKNM